MQNEPITKVPQGKKIFEFLQELDGENQRLKDAWIFMDESVMTILRHQLEAGDYIAAQHCLILPHETDDRMVASITFVRNGDTSWYFVTRISCNKEDCPYHISFTEASSHITEVICLSMEE